MIPEVIPATCVDGTWGWHGLAQPEDEWTHPKHPCQVYLREHGISNRCDARGRGFSWLSKLEGYMLLRRLFRPRAGLPAWEVGGANFYDFHLPLTVDPRFHLPGHSTHAFAHSHGGNLPFVACHLGLRVNVLVTVSTPIRWDVLQQYGPLARPNIAWHVHYYSVGDEIQVAGEYADGRFGWLREHPLADENIKLPAEAGHTGLLNNPKFFGELLTAIDRIHARHGAGDYLADVGARWPVERIASALHLG